MANSIGIFDFVSLTGAVERVKQRPRTVDRPGVTGTGVWLTGERGAQFTLRSLVDCMSYSDGHVLLAQYMDTIGGDPVNIVQSDYEFSDENIQFVILDVRGVRIQETAKQVGGLNDELGEAILEAEWTLIAVPTPAA